MRGSAPRLIPLVVMAAAVGAGCGDPVGLNPAAVAVELAPADTLVLQGSAVPLRLRILDAEGRAIEPLDGGLQPLWDVSDPGVLEGDPAGGVRAVGPGIAEVTVRYGDLSARSRVRVNPPELTVSVAGAYLLQSVQRFSGDIPLVAGRTALLRVFLVGDRPNFYRPGVRATIHLPDTSHTFALDRPSGVPTQVLEMEAAFHAVVPGAFIRPGAELTVEVEPDGVPLGDGGDSRYPAEGRLSLDVREIPPFDLMLVPVRTPDGRTARITASSAGSFARFTLDVLPLHETSVQVRAPYTTSASLDEGWSQLLQEIKLLRTLDTRMHYYYGVVHAQSAGGFGGLSAGATSRVSAGIDTEPATMAHEIGHNMALGHAPCGPVAAFDRNYPYPDGSIGHVGYDPRTRSLVAPRTADLMTYCSPEWISDYHYEKALAYREEHDWPDAAAFEPSLILWGRVTGDGRLHLEPALQASAPETLPDTDGDYTLQGTDRHGAVLFTLSFDPASDAHGSSRSFLFALPTATFPVHRLARIRLTGPEGDIALAAATTGQDLPGILSATEDPRTHGTSLHWDADAYPLLLVRDRRTHEILAIGRRGVIDLPGLDPDDLRLTASDGVRTYPLEISPPDA